MTVLGCSWYFLTAWEQLKASQKMVRNSLISFLTFNNDVHQNAPAGLTVSIAKPSGGHAPIAKELLGEEAVNAYFLSLIPIVPVVLNHLQK